MYTERMKEINQRVSDYPIDDIFLKRYSSRAMSGEPILKDDLMMLLKSLN